MPRRFPFHRLARFGRQQDEDFAIYPDECSDALLMIPFSELERRFQLERVNHEVMFRGIRKLFASTCRCWDNCSLASIFILSVGGTGLRVGPLSVSIPPNSSNDPWTTPTFQSITCLRITNVNRS